MLEHFTWICLNIVTKITFTCLEICKAHRVSLTRYVFDEHYANKCKRQIYAVPKHGVVDSIRSLLNNYNQLSIHLVKLLLASFQ